MIKFAIAIIIAVWIFGGFAFAVIASFLLWIGLILCEMQEQKVKEYQRRNG